MTTKKLIGSRLTLKSAKRLLWKYTHGSIVAYKKHSHIIVAWSEYATYMVIPGKRRLFWREYDVISITSNN